VIQAANTRSASARLSGGQRMAVGGSVALGLGLAAYGVVGSYRAVSGLAQRKGVPLAHLVPVGIDGGLIGVVVHDLVPSWIRQPIGWPRQFVRILTVGTSATTADRRLSRASAHRICSCALRGWCAGSRSLCVAGLPVVTSCCLA
jgi:hypothetical protein